ncbi:hypothetical protein ACFEBT_004417, partial [Escherichia coli]
MILVTDSITTGRTAPSGCFSSQLSQLVSRIHKERNIQVCAAFNGIVKTIAYSALFDHGLASKSDQRFA